MIEICAQIYCEIRQRYVARYVHRYVARYVHRVVHKISGGARGTLVFAVC
jgi:hypothetical protein